MRALAASLLLAGRLVSANLAVNGDFASGLAGWEPIWAREAGKVTARLQGAELRVASESEKDWSLAQANPLPVRPGEVYEASALAQLEGGGADLGLVYYKAGEEVMDWFGAKTAALPAKTAVPLRIRFTIPEGCQFIRLRATGEGRGKSRWKQFKLERLGTLADFRAEFKKKWAALGMDADFEIPALAAQDNSLYSMQAIPGGIQLAFSGEGDFPGPPLTKAGDHWILPFNQGLRIPAEDPGFRQDWPLELGAGHFMSMPFIALERGSRTYLMVCDSFWDASLRMQPPSGRSQASFSFSFARSQKPEWRKVLILQVQGGLVQAAKAYRALRQRQVENHTLAAKSLRNPEVKKLYGAVNLWRWKNRFHWSSDPEPERFAQEAKSLGIHKVLWSHEVPGAASAQKIRDLGYLVGRYKNAQDIYAPDTPMTWVEKRGWPEDRVLKPDGGWQRGWVSRHEGKEYPGGVRCSEPGLKFVRKEVGEEQARIPYSAVFLDTTTATGLNECFDPAHPTTRAQDMQWKRRHLGYAADELGLVTGSETGADWAVDVVHYFEGMMSLGLFRLPDAGYDLFSRKAPTPEFLRFQVSPRYRVPLFELAYHDCVVNYWYWGDSSNRLEEFWDFRDLLNILYGTPPFWHVDEELWAKAKPRFLKSYRDVVPVAEKLAGLEMVNFRALSADSMVQETEFEGGVKVRVDFKKKSFKVSGLRP